MADCAVKLAPDTPPPAVPAAWELMEVRGVLGAWLGEHEAGIRHWEARVWWLTVPRPACSYAIERKIEPFYKGGKVQVSSWERVGAGWQGLDCDHG